MQIFISGNPRSGKTTLVKRIYQEYKDIFVGFWTEEIKENKRRVGFKIVTTWGEEKVLASIYKRSLFRVGKYFVYPENLDPIVRKLEKMNFKNKIILIDEIGRMEFYSEKFRNFVLNLINDKSKDILAVVHRSYLHLVKDYVWLEIGKWWDVYKRVKREIESWIKKNINKR